MERILLSNVTFVTFQISIPTLLGLMVTDDLVLAEETTSGLPLLISGSTLLIALALFYIGRSLWIARREWPHCRTDTKVLYLLVAPLLTLAVDILAFTDRLFWTSTSEKPPRSTPALVPLPFRAKAAMRSDV